VFPWHPQLVDFCQASSEYLEAAAQIQRDRAEQASREEDPEWVTLSMARSLLLKTAEDLRAVVCLDSRGLVGPTYAVARSLFEAFVDMLYLVHADASERQERSRRLMCCSLVEDGCARILAAKIQGVDAKDDVPNYDALHKDALVECLESMRDQIEDLAISDEDLKRFRELVSGWEKLAADKGHKALIQIGRLARPSMARRIAGIKEQHPVPAIIKNLEFSYRVVYAQASAFVHSSGGMYLAGRGRPIDEMRAEPASFVVLVARDIVRVSEPLYHIGIPEVGRRALEKADPVLHVLASTVPLKRP